MTSQPERAIRPVDRHIALVARARGGVYAHDSEAVDMAERAAASRLRELERLGLATSAGPHAWTLPADLLDQLEARHRAAPPKHRLFIRKEPLLLADQTRYLGPVWLDRVEPMNEGLSVFSLRWWSSQLARDNRAEQGTSAIEPIEITVERR